MLQRKILAEIILFQENMLKMTLGKQQWDENESRDVKQLMIPEADSLLYLYSLSIYIPHVFSAPFVFAAPHVFTSSHVLDTSHVFATAFAFITCILASPPLQ